jgi:hypothetical protein
MFISMYGPQNTTLNLDAGKREKFRLSYGGQGYFRRKVVCGGALRASGGSAAST